MDLASKVSTKDGYGWDSGVFELSANSFPAADARTARHKVIAVDYGCKQNILRCLTAAGCDVEVVPATTSAAEILARRPDGIFWRTVLAIQPRQLLMPKRRLPSC